MQNTKIVTFLNNSNKYIDTDISINGWVMSKRSQKDITFVKLYDGSTPEGIQLILNNSNFNNSNFNNLDNINTSTSLNVVGTFVVSMAKGQKFEVNVKKFTIYGNTNLDDYPLSKGKLPLDYLRNYHHLRLRTNSFGSIFRIKSSINYATNDYYKSKLFHYINPNIMTNNECEGGAGTFKVTEFDFSDHANLPTLNNSTKHDFSKDHFNRIMQLTVSSQLELEAIACSIGSVYTTNKSFRSEHSNTSKHLSEFEHLEIEDVFNDLESLMDIGEEYIKYVAKYLLTNNETDIMNLDKFVSKNLYDKIVKLLNTTFVRITYNDTVKLLNNNNIKINYGDDLSSEMENFITDYYKSPVFVTLWPKSLKSFYMKTNINDSSLCDNFDLLMPYKVGELIGGSMREDNLDILLDNMKTKNISTTPLEFYIDLRRFGSIPHGGFGLGLDRMCMLFTGMENIKDVVAFPVYYKKF